MSNQAKVGLSLLVISLLLFGIFMFTKKNDEDDNNVNVTETLTPTDISPSPIPTPKPTIEPVAVYKVEFTADWSADTHPDQYPDNAHFSPFIAYSHNSSPESNIFVEEGTATEGVEIMAETGAPDVLISEVDSIILANNALNQVKGNRIDSPGSDEGNIDVSPEFSNLTFVTMLAPSPDWFVAGQSINLIEDGEWVEVKEVKLTTFDAGTDSGTTLTASDLDTDPKEPITQYPDELQNLGIITITRVN